MPATLHVFLAEDDMDDQEMLMEMMAEAFPQIIFTTANTGSSALTLLQSIAADDVPRLILLDYNLPEMSGAEILEHISRMKHLEKSRRVVWSTSNSPVYQQRCLALGAQLYIVKPVDIAAFRNIAEQLVALCISPA